LADIDQSWYGTPAGNILKEAVDPDNDVSIALVADSDNTHLICLLVNASGDLLTVLKDYQRLVLAEIKAAEQA
jgi:hypothetical protein